MVFFYSTIFYCCLFSSYTKKVGILLFFIFENYNRQASHASIGILSFWTARVTLRYLSKPQEDLFGAVSISGPKIKAHFVREIAKASSKSWTHLIAESTGIVLEEINPSQLQEFKVKVVHVKHKPRFSTISSVASLSMSLVTFWWDLSKS